MTNWIIEIFPFLKFSSLDETGHFAENEQLWGPICQYVYYNLVQKKYHDESTVDISSLSLHSK